MERVSKASKQLALLLLGSVLALSLPGLFPGNVSAHRVNVFAWVEGDTVFVECKYPDGKRVNEGTILVLDAGGAELLAGTTDQQGNFSFKIPKQGELKIVLEAGMGHRAEWTIPKEELAAAGETESRPLTTSAGEPPRSEPSPTTAKEAAPRARPRAGPAASGKTATKAPVTSPQQAPKPEPARVASGEAASVPQPPLAADIEQGLERALDKKLAPILRMLAESRDHGPKLSDVLGGIGYIIGLVGIAAYFKRKSK